MSRTTVGYIQLPRLKSLLTSCRRSKVRCQPLIARSKPGRPFREAPALRRQARPAGTPTAPERTRPLQTPSRDSLVSDKSPSPSRL